MTKSTTTNGKAPKARRPAATKPATPRRRSTAGGSPDPAAELDKEIRELFERLKALVARRYPRAVRVAVYWEDSSLAMTAVHDDEVRRERLSDRHAANDHIRRHLDRLYGDAWAVARLSVGFADPAAEWDGRAATVIRSLPEPPGDD
jgi:hypothetical protein